MIFDGNVETRHIHMNVPHAANPKPSWYGDSVGHYEGDTLVIDTIALNDKTFVDAYRTPHTAKIHVTERWRLIDNGDKLEVLTTIDDPDTFNQPWQALRRYQKAKREFVENICSETTPICSTTARRPRSSRISEKRTTREFLSPDAVCRRRLSHRRHAGRLGSTGAQKLIPDQDRL
jgi:hypothetical protein